MLRSVFAIVIAVIAGLAAARLVEGVGARIFPPSAAVDFADAASPLLHADAIPAGYKAMLVAGWAAAGFIAAGIALAIARAWAPVGWLGAATMMLLAIMTLMGEPFGPLVWLGALAGPALGGWGAVKLTGASYTPPARGPERSSP